MDTATIDVQHRAVLTMLRYRDCTEPDLQGIADDVPGALQALTDLGLVAVCGETYTITRAGRDAAAQDAESEHPCESLLSISVRAYNDRAGQRCVTVRLTGGQTLQLDAPAAFELRHALTLELQAAEWLPAEPLSRRELLALLEMSLGTVSSRELSAQELSRKGLALRERRHGDTQWRLTAAGHDAMEDALPPKRHENLDPHQLALLIRLRLYGARTEGTMETDELGRAPHLVERGLIALSGEWYSITTAGLAAVAEVLGE